MDRTESARRVAHPLARLRNAIRNYVILEGLAVVGIYLVVWFWVGLILDFGFFKLFTIDWVQELPRSFRVGTLVLATLGLVGVIVFKVLIRLFREFRAPALALILERRFPNLLGDRLITAVELADPQVAVRYGYSQAMIDETIAEAAERVEQIPLHQAFEWSRLRRLWTTILVLTFGVYLVTGIGYCAITRTTDVARFFGQFNDVSAIWFERNILLQDTIWPRRAHLELIDFPGDSIRIGRDAQPPTLRVRALKWVIADSKAPEGWRALRWHDVNEDLLGEPVPRLDLPGEWADWSVDQIELQLEKKDGTKALSDETVSNLEDLFAKVDARASSPRMSRTFRKLVVPTGVEVEYTGKTSRSEQTLPPGMNREFSGAVANLRESLRFTIRGEDYYTSPKWIIVVPPPVLMELLLDEAQPAYIHQTAPSDARLADLKGKMQHFDRRTVSLTGEKSSIPVPTGTELVLTGIVDKALKLPNGVRLLPFKPGTPDVAATVEQITPESFTIRLMNVTTLADFVIEFIDTDGVAGRRHVEIRPVHDTAPDVEVQVEVMRKVSQAYMVTPQALVPFSGKVRDDRGLNEVDYVYTIERVEDGVDARNQLARLLGASAVGAVNPELTLAYIALLTRVTRPAADVELSRDARAEPSVTFQKLWVDQKSRAVPMSRLADLLARSPTGSLLKMFDLDPEMEVFSIGKIGLRMEDDAGHPLRSRLRLGVTATDNNIETGPGVGQNKEKFTILVVSENELLAEIAKEEEGLHFKLEEAVNRLKDGKTKLDKLAQELPTLNSDEFSPMARRTEELLDASSRSADTTREVLGDYRRILKELRANQVRANNRIDTVSDKICDPLEAAVNVDFVQTDDALRELHKQLEEKTGGGTNAALAQQHLKTLIDRLAGVLDHMGEITNFNAVLRMAIDIEKGERAQHEGLKKTYEAKVKSILEGLDDPVKPVDK